MGLYTQITRIRRYTEGSLIQTKPLSCMLPLHKVTRLYLTHNVCKLVTLRELSHLYRNSNNRVILDGTDINWFQKVEKQKQIIAKRQLKRQKGKRSKKMDDKLMINVFADFMQHAEIRAM